jgi:uncharacterized protein (DUF4213/DUF364 family)
MTRPIAEELIDCVERVAARLRLPPVRELHLPPEIAWGTKDGEFCALELDDGSIGMSYVLLGDTLARLTGEACAGRRPMAGTDALAAARWYRSADAVERTIGFAAVNAVSQHLFARAGWRPDDAADSIGGMAPAAGERVGMVGLFPGLARRIADTGASLVVVELNPALAGERDGYVVTLDASALRQCTKVMSTTTLLLNDTLDAILAQCASASTLALVGPGGGCVPDPLFVRGVTRLAGTAVADRDGFVEAIRAGRAWGAAARKYSIDRSGYPGLDALIARCGR